MQNALALLNHLHNLKTVPASLFVAQDVIGRDIELENAPRILMLRALHCAIYEVGDDCEEDDDGRRYPHHAEHSDDDDDCQNSM
jgi:hypothetical protein